MTIRLDRAVLNDDGRIDPTRWHTRVIAGISVGHCDCQPDALVRGERIIARSAPATAVCDTCGANAGRPVSAGPPQSAEQEPVGVPGRVRGSARPASPERKDRGQRRPRRARQRRA